MPLGLNRQDGGNRKQFCQEASGLIYETFQSSAPPAASEMLLYVYWTRCTALFADMHDMTLLNWGG